MAPSSEPVRVDKWLWASRLVKTRPLAQEAVKGGRVEVNGKPIKPSREVRPGDRLELTTGPLRRTVVVKATAARRQSAALAAELFDETAESVAARERHAEDRRIAWAAGVVTDARPTKRDRRRYDALTQMLRDE